MRNAAPPVRVIVKVWCPVRQLNDVKFNTGYRRPLGDTRLITQGAGSHQLLSRSPFIEWATGIALNAQADALNVVDS